MSHGDIDQHAHRPEALPRDIMSPRYKKLALCTCLLPGSISWHATAGICCCSCAILLVVLYPLSQCCLYSWCTGWLEQLVMVSDTQHPCCWDVVAQLLNMHGSGCRLSICPQYHSLHIGQMEATCRCTDCVSVSHIEQQCSAKGFD